ncbi:MAG: heme-binding domain-containing protein [Actinobacteria bacterium]|nr:heme-binding domain-containing protein [Actinomycetota bacterium]
MGDEPTSRRWVTALVWAARVAVALFVVIQLVPYGWKHSNPPVEQDAPWPDARSAAIARESCYSCHSNETDWPWYSYVAPASWLVRRDVERGRDELNFSDWADAEGERDDAIEVIREGEMPPSQYTRVHRGASLTDAEATVLIAALQTMGGGNGELGGDDD